MIQRLAVLALVCAAAVAALLLGRRRNRRAARLRRRAERQARRAGPAATVPMDARRPSMAAIVPVEAIGHEARPEDASPGAEASDIGALGAASPEPASPAEPEFRSIRGIGPALEDRLRAAGVTKVAQVAGWSDADIEAIAPLLRVTPDRVRSQAWVEQARSLVSDPPA